MPAEIGETRILQLIFWALLAFGRLLKHSDDSIVADRPHLIHKTQEQASRMLLFLPIVLTAYAFGLILFLWARARRMRRESG